MPGEYWATDFISRPPKWMESRSALFVFPDASCHSALPPLLPPLRVALRETRLIDPGNGREKNPSSVWNVAMVSAELRPLVAGNRDCGDFVHPLPSARFLSSVAPCHSHVGLHHVCRPSHTIPAPLRAEAALRASHFHPTTLRMSRLGRGWVMEGGEACGWGRRGDAVHWWWRMMRRTKVM